MSYYTLMNKDIALFGIDMHRGQIREIFDIKKRNLRLLPLAIQPVSGMELSIDQFNDWWSGRRIPASRMNIKELYWHLDTENLDELAEKSLGLSLSDQYWIRPDKAIRWADVNFFENEFSEDIGILLIDGDWNRGSLISPDNTSDGVIGKKWKILDGARYLLKGSFSPFMQSQPYREVFASRIAAKLFNRHKGNWVVPYGMLIENDRVLSMCPNFITVDTEYLPIRHIYQQQKPLGWKPTYHNCVRYYKDYKWFLDLLLILDYIVLNEDRHTGNFGFIRSALTGDIIKPAPVFDTGSSLFHSSISTDKNHVSSKPFSNKFSKQIELVPVKEYEEDILAVKEGYKDIFADVFKTSAEGEERLSHLLNAVGDQIDDLLSRVKGNYYKGVDIF